MTTESFPHLPLPYMKESEAIHRVEQYMTDPGRHAVIQGRARLIKQMLKRDLDRIATELALFDTTALSIDPTTQELIVLDPTALTRAH